MARSKAYAWGLAAAFLAPAGSAAAQETPAFEWRVKDRFRLFDQASQGARDKVDAFLNELRANPDAKLEQHYDAFLRLLSDAEQAAAHPAELRRSNYRPAGNEVGRTSGRYHERYLYPQSYTVELRNAELAGRTCSYSGLTAWTAPCEEWTAVPIAGGKGAGRAAWVNGDVHVAIDDGRAARVPIDFADETIVALGDSFISGEGNPDRPSMVNPDDPHDIFNRPSWGSKAQLGRDIVRVAEWWDEPCHRSLLSWPVLASLAYAARDERRAVTLVHLGCSGAVVDDLTEHGEVDLPGGGDETESQLQLLDRLLQLPTSEWRQRKVDKVLLSIGGNDIGFVGVLTTLTLPPNGYFLDPVAARIVGGKARAICPYENSGAPLSNLCSSRTTAEVRRTRLQPSFLALQQRLASMSISAEQVYHSLYPNPLICEGGKPCDTNPENDKPRPRPAKRPKRSGFEALMGSVTKLGRGPFYRTWNFELAYRPDKLRGKRLYEEWPELQCDAVPDSNDWEVCQGLLVHYWLNEKVLGSPFQHITKTVELTAGYGLAMEAEGQSRALPTAARDTWEVAPNQLQPYRRFEDGRWFRLPNDSIQTQFHYYGDEPRFHHGTVHPTYRAHLEYAQAALDEAFKSVESAAGAQNAGS